MNLFEYYAHEQMIRDRMARIRAAGSTGGAALTRPPTRTRTRRAIKGRAERLRTFGARGLGRAGLWSTGA